MDEQKWIEFSKEAVPTLEKLSNLAKKYGINHLSASFSADGYSNCFCITEDEVHCSLTSFSSDDPIYNATVNGSTVGEIPKELQ